jgi:glycosyltransferase involved in cell wall biosynthesis
VRLALITGEYPPRRGGVADYTANLAAALAEAGHQVTVITSPPRAAPGGTGSVSVALVPAWGLRHLPALWRTLRETRPDTAMFQYVPHLYGRAGVSPGAALVPMVARVAGVTRVVSVLHELHQPWGRSLRTVLSSAVQRLQLVPLLALSHAAVVTNPAYFAAVTRRRVRPAALAEIPVGASIPVQPVTSAERLHARRGLAGRAPTLVGELSVSSVGRRPDDLVAVLEAIGPDARLACLGGLDADIPRATLLRRLLASRGLEQQVNWTGYLAADELSRSLSTLDVYVHTGERGASTRSTALVSALAHGLPVAAYRGPETPSYLRDGESIVLVDRVDGKSLAAAVVRLLDDDELRRRVAAGARLSYVRHLSWMTIAEQVLST